MASKKTVTLYKLTDRDGVTRAGKSNALTWTVGVIHEVGGRGKELCSPDVIHAYESPLLAVLLNPIHADIREPRLFECRGRIVARDGQLKCGVKSLKVVRELDVPKVTTTQRVRFAILCALKVYTEPSFVRWTHAWLDGSDRSQAAAATAARAAEAAWVARAAWVAWVARAADAAARAARAAARAAEADAAWAAARAAARAARVARAAEAAEADAAWAASAAWAAARVNLKAIAKKALTDEPAKA